MALINDIRRQRVAYADGKPVDGVVRVRGVDLQIGGRTIVAERRVPLEVVITESGRESRYRVPREPGIPAVAFLAAPVVAFVFARIVRSRRRQ